MAKMFYSLEEAAEKLGISQDEVKDLASVGKLQQFRDRDKLMFKRDAVDTFAANKDALGSGLAEAATRKNSSSGTRPGIDSGGTADNINLDEQPPETNKTEDPRQKTGVSVFDADEVEEADPMAQTQMTNSIEESDTDLMIESVGSGSGLLDLTRESDDTSLGAELLDEIYPTGSGESPEIGSGVEARTQESSDDGAVFDTAIAAEPSTSGLEGLAEGSGMASMMESPGIVAVGQLEEIYDPVSSFFVAGALFGATIALTVVFIIATGIISGASSGPQTYMTTQPPQNLLIVVVSLLVGSIVFAGVGFGVGRMQANS